MEINIPKCIGGKDCHSICSAKGCSNRPFMCLQGCQCEVAHKQCDTNFKWKNFKELLSKKFMESSGQTKNYLKQIDQIFKSISKQFQFFYNQIKSLQYAYGLNQIQREIFSKIKQGRVDELSGNLMSQIQLKSVRFCQFTIIDDNILESKKMIEKQSQVLFQMLSDLTRQRQLLPLNSKLLKDPYTIFKFFTKNIKQYTLLYRASENNFQASKFHEKCDGKKHTLTILKTQFGNVIGGYTPLPWDKNKNGIYQADNSMQSFIFSVTNKQKLKLIERNKNNAIYHYNSYGPTFGSSYDIYIPDRSNQNNSGARPGTTYNYDNQYGYNQQSYKKWSGQSNGCNYKIQEWQVYSIVFRT